MNLGVLSFLCHFFFRRVCSWCWPWTGVVSVTELRAQVRLSLLYRTKAKASRLMNSPPLNDCLQFLLLPCRSLMSAAVLILLRILSEINFFAGIGDWWRATKKYKEACIIVAPKKVCSRGVPKAKVSVVQEVWQYSSLKSATVIAVFSSEQSVLLYFPPFYDYVLLFFIFILVLLFTKVLANKSPWQNSKFCAIGKKMRV